ncbi:MAG: hypothetical protein GY780_10945 [bacterium]|nr:hypothetical protein [bacterium]
MQYQNIISNFHTLGPVFWVAAVAIALGLTLLLVSVVVQLKKVATESQGKMFSFKMPSPKIKKTPIRKNPLQASGQAIDKTNTGYAPRNHHSTPAISLSDDASPQNRDLVNRLQVAADALEEISTSMGKNNFTLGFSSLKADPDGVEYLFKTTAV